MSAGLLVSALLLLQNGGVEGLLREPLDGAREPARPLADIPLEQLIADLGDDDVRGNAKAACEELLARPFDAVRHAPSAPRGGLEAALEDDDPQRRFLAAWVLAFRMTDRLSREHPDLAEKVARTLIPHLGEDAVRRNGLMASEALRAMESCATPYLVAARQYAGGQLAQAIDHQIGTHAADWWNGWGGWGRSRGPRFFLEPQTVEAWAFPSLSPRVPSTEERNLYVRAQLRDDGVRMNASSARWELRYHLDKQRPGLLEAALNDWDHQARQFAAQAVRWGNPGSPPQRLYDVALEGLADDGLHQQDGVASAKESMLFLGRRYREGRSWVMAGLRSRDAVVRYRSALVAAWAGERDLRSFAPVLVEHLADNDIVADAAGAMDALVAQGEAVRPFLEEVLPASDPQLDRLARQTMRRIDRAGGRRTVPEDFPRGIDPGLGYRE